MIEEFECKGYWWLPNKRDDCIAGTLKFNPIDGASLELMGLFEPMQKQELKEKILKGSTVRCKIIHGFCGTSEVTLMGCEGWLYGPILPGIGNFEFRVNKIFLNKYFNKEKDIKFKIVHVNYSYLDEWANIFGGEIDYPRNGSGKYNVSFKYVSPESIVLADGSQYRISLVFRGLTSLIIRKEFKLRQETSIAIEMKEETPFEQFVSLIAQIQNFLSLATYKSVYPLRIIGIDEEWAEKSNREVEILYRAQGKPEKPQEVWPGEMLFIYSAIKNTKASLNNFFEKAELLKPIYNLYFAVRYKPEMYAELQFLSLAYALEVFHSRFIKHPKNQQYKLHQRLEELVKVKKKKDLFSEFIGDKVKFIEKVKFTRNYHTHYNKKIEKKAAKGVEFILLIRQMKLVLEIYLLKVIGFSWKEIDTLIRENIRYKGCISLIERQKPTEKYTY